MARSTPMRPAGRVDTAAVVQETAAATAPADLATLAALPRAVSD